MVKLVLVALSVVLVTTGFATQPVVAALNSKDALCVASPPAASGTKILTIGDSLALGATGDYTWRYFLWKQLATHGGINMVGRYSKIVDPVTIKWNSNDYVCPFDDDTFAVPGTFMVRYLRKSIAADGGTYSTSESSVVKAQVKAQKAQVLIVAAGINDLTRPESTKSSAKASPSALLGYAKRVVQEARAGNPSIKILFQTVSSYATDVPYAVPSTTRANIKSYNAKLTAAVPGWSSSKSPVRVVKTVQNWGKLDLTYDGLHPNAQGEAQIAHDYAVALNKLGVGPVPPAVPNLKSYLGPRTAPILAKPVVSGKDVILKWTMASGSVRTRIERRSSVFGSWKVVGVKGLVDGANCKDANGRDIAAGGAFAPPYSCTWTHANGYAAGASYRVWSARGLAGITTPQPQGDSGLFLYSVDAKLRSNSQAASK